MTPFRYERAATVANALDAGARPGTAFLAGGTNLVDLMRYGIEAPTALVDITRLHLAVVEPLPGGGVRIGALVRNADLADHPHVRTHFPLLSQALLSGASPQLRNVATTGGNLLQSTRCYYFNDASFSRCNKRVPGSGCAAIAGQNRIHAILGQADDGADSGESCIATHPSDMCVALAALDAAVETEGPGGTRTVPFAGFHRLPGATPWIDTVLRPGELVVAVTLPPPRFAGNFHYLKARDRRSYAYALVSVAAGLELRDGVVAAAGLALGGVASKPWRVAEAEAALVGRAPEPDGFGEAAAILLRGARGYAHNGFKVPLAVRCVVRALTLAAEGRWDRPA